MAELKTQPTAASVDAFLDSLTDDRQRQDSHTIVAMLSRISGAEARMWGANIVGFGTYRYRYPDGREMIWMQVGFSPRKQNLTFYLRGGHAPQADLLQQLGNHKTGKGCLYIKKLDDVDLPTLERLIAASIADLQPQ